MSDRIFPLVDVVVVSYNSADELPTGVGPLAAEADVNVIVVDNASSDDSVGAVAGLGVTTIALDTNEGFAHGNNVGWRSGEAPYVLMLNPDATIDATALRTLVETLERFPRAGAVAPRIVDAAGEIDPSLRRFPRLRSTYAQALFLHRLFPGADWTDELVRDDAVYDRPGTPDWVSGACILLRREALAALGGLDEGFFMYCEDIDLCRRLWDAGWEVRYEPSALARHEGGASAPRASLLPVLAASRVRYARKHYSVPHALAERTGVALGALTHLVVSPRRPGIRQGHTRALWHALTGRPARPSR